MAHERLSRKIRVMLVVMLLTVDDPALADDKPDAAIQQLIAQLKDDDPQVRLIAFMAIRAEYGPRAKDAVPTLIEMLKAADYDTDHLQTRKALIAIGPAAESGLRELLHDDDAKYRARAAMTLWQMSLADDKPHSAVRDLITAAADMEAVVRYWSVRALGSIGATSDDVVPALINTLNDDNDAVRREAVLALANIGSRAKSSTQQLIDLLHHDDIATRSGAVFALGRIGPAARGAIDKLIALIKDEILREDTADALKRIGVTEHQVPALVDLLTHDETRSRQLAALCLARVGPAAKPAVDALTASLDEEPMREFAIHALGHIGADARPAVPELIKLLTDESYFIRAGAAEALGKIGPGAKTAIPALEAARNDSDPLPRRQAENALRKIVP